MRAADDIRHRVNAYLAKELGDTSPIDETRIALLKQSVEWVHALRESPPSVTTDDGGVKGNPDHNALLKHMALCRGLCKDLEAPVLAKRAAAAAQQPAGLTPAQIAREQMRALEETPPS